MAFIFACINVIDSVDVVILTASFFNCLPPVERSTVEKGMKTYYFVNECHGQKCHNNKGSAVSVRAGNL